MVVPARSLSAKISFALAAIFVGAVAVDSVACAQDASTAATDSQRIYFAPDDPPTPSGGLAAVVLNARYPEAALRDSVEGRVVARFVVTPEGRARDISILVPVHPALDEEAARAIRLTAFEPGTIGGQPVPAWLSLPVKFQIEDAAARTASRQAAADTSRGGSFPASEFNAFAAPPSEPDVYARGETDEPPVLIGGLEGLQQRLRYPETARQAEAEGRAVVAFVVGPDGRPRDLRVTESAGHPDLDWEALRVVRGAQFEPGTAGGEPVSVEATLPVTFALED